MEKTIAVLAGDGIGPEVMVQAIRVLDQIAKKFNHKFEYQEALIGGAAYEVHLNHFPPESKDICKNSDAILFGSVGGPVREINNPKWNNCEKNALLGLRKEFNFHCNLRPVKVYPELTNISPLKIELIQDGIDLLIIRELLGGLYFGKHETVEDKGQKFARDTMEYSESQIRAVVHNGFQAANKRRQKLCSVDKANVLDCSKLWRSIVDEIANEYPDVKYEHMLVDNAVMQLIKNPSYFDIILTENTFGDILSDASAVLPGSLGLMPSASLNRDGFGMYEPSGGSAQDIAGLGIANPIAQILSAAMMLKYSFEMFEESELIESAVTQAIKDGYRTFDIYRNEGQQVNSEEMTNAIISNL